MTVFIKYFIQLYKRCLYIFAAYCFLICYYIFWLTSDSSLFLPEVIDVSQCRCMNVLFEVHWLVKSHTFLQFVLSVILVDISRVEDLFLQLLSSLLTFLLHL